MNLDQGININFIAPKRRGITLLPNKNKKLQLFSYINVANCNLGEVKQETRLAIGLNH